MTAAREWRGELYRGRHRLPTRLEDLEFDRLPRTPMRGDGGTRLPRGICADL